jgi:hypothetical protein
MNVGAFASAMKAVSMISNQSSLSTLYKSVEFAPESLRACSEFGNLEISFETGLDEAVLLDCEAVNVILRQLPSHAEILFEKKENRVRWTTDARSGSLHVVQQDREIPELSNSSYPWKPSARFGEALVLAASSVQAASVSIGLYGLVIQACGQVLRLVSSNTISASVVVIPAYGHTIQDRITLRPPVPKMLARLLGSHPKLMIDVSERGVFVEDEQLRGHLPAGSPLDHDLCQLADKYSIGSTRVQIDPLAIKEFLSMAKGLAGKLTDSTVQIEVKAGNLILHHQSSVSRTQEYLAAQRLDPSIHFDPVAFSADLLAVPVDHVDTLILDYLPEKRLILHREESGLQYTFIIGGK